MLKQVRVVLIVVAVSGLIGTIADGCSNATAPTPAHDIAASTTSSTDVTAVTAPRSTTTTIDRTTTTTVGRSTTTTADPTTITTVPPSPVELQVQSGVGIEYGPQFTVPPNVRGWSVAWSFDCELLGAPGNFGITVIGLRGSSPNNIGVDESGNESASTQYYYDTGNFQLEIDTQCSWQYTIITIAR